MTCTALCIWQPPGMRGLPCQYLSLVTRSHQIPWQWNYSLSSYNLQLCLRSSKGISRSPKPTHRQAAAYLKKSYTHCTAQASRQSLFWVLHTLEGIFLRTYLGPSSGSTNNLALLCADSGQLSKGSMGIHMLRYKL